MKWNLRNLEQGGRVFQHDFEEQLAVHLKKFGLCIYRRNVATLVATLRTRVLLPLGSQWKGEQMSNFGWGPFSHIFWMILSMKVCKGSFVGTDGNLEITISERPAL